MTTRTPAKKIQIERYGRKMWVDPADYEAELALMKQEEEEQEPSQEVKDQAQAAFVAALVAGNIPHEAIDKLVALGPLGIMRQYEQKILRFSSPEREKIVIDAVDQWEKMLDAPPVTQPVRERSGLLPPLPVPQKEESPTDPSPHKAEASDSFTVQTPTGKDVNITIRVYAGEPKMLIELPSSNIKTSGFDVNKLKTPQSGATHWIGEGKTAIGLDAANAQKVTEAIAAWREAQKQTPEGKFKALRSEREDLQHEIAGHWDAMTEAREKAYGQDTGAGWETAKKHEQAAEAAKAKLAAFDIAHPEVSAQIKKEKGEAKERFLASN